MSDTPINPDDIIALERPPATPAPTGPVAQPDAPTADPSSIEVTVTARRPTTTTVAPQRGSTPPRVVEQTPPDAAQPFDAPADALQLAEPINSGIPDAYAFAAVVIVDGTPIGPPLVFEVSANNYYQADKYFLELALGALPDDFQEDYWASGDQKEIEIRCGILNYQPKSLIIGLVDNCEIDFLQRKITLRGRDLTCKLIDNKTAEKFANQTASQVAETLATRRGLSSKITKTTTIVGTYFQREHAKLTTDVTEHDLLTFLAEQEGFNYWVEGRTLHFEPPPPAKTQPFVVNYVPPTSANIASGNFIQLVARRAETLANDIVVKVISFDAKKGTKVEASAKRSRTKSTSKVTRDTSDRGTPPQPYVYRVPGLNKEQAQNYANKMLDQISKHERVIRCEMPFDPILDARTRISLRGTGTEYDQPYFIDSIEYSGSFEHGSRMEISAKNSSPQSVVAL